MAYDYTIKGNPLMSGFQSGQAIGQGLRGAFKDRPAMQEALAQIAQGANPQEVIQQLAAQNPQAAEMLMQKMQQQYKTQIMPQVAERYGLQNQQLSNELQQQQKRQDIGRQLFGDDPLMTLAMSDPETFGLITRYNKDMDAKQRMDVGVPLMVALKSQNPEQKRQLILDASSKMEKFSPTLASSLKDIVKAGDDRIDAALTPVLVALRETGFMPSDPQKDDSRTAQQKNLETYVRLVEEGKEEQAQRFAQAANMNPSERMENSINQALTIEEGKNKSGRLDQMVLSGQSQLKTIGGIDRALQLLDDVQTSGFNQMKKSITDFFGKTPADEAEFAYLTGKTVLGQLKETFGAQFTNEEAKRLERLEAGLGRSTEANRVILQRARAAAVEAAKRGYRAAVEVGDMFTANEIAQGLRMVGESVDGSPMQPQEPQQPQGGSPDVEERAAGYLGGR